MGLIEQIAEDWRSYRGAGEAGRSPALNRCWWLVATYRLGAWATDPATPAAWRMFGRTAYFPLNFVVSVINAADIRPGARIGRRFMVHTSRGLLITNGVQIGDDCVANNGVCVVGRANFRSQGVATIGNDVRLGVGSKVLGGVHIGNHVTVGANAVVLKDVPDHHTAVGVPAELKPGRPVSPVVAQFYPEAVEREGGREE